MLEAAALLAKIDALAAALAELRAEVIDRGLGTIVPNPSSNGQDRDEELIEVSTASSAYNVPGDTLRFWCRHESIGVKRNGRWLICPARLRARLERE